VTKASARSRVGASGIERRQPSLPPEPRQHAIITPLNALGGHRREGFRVRLPLGMKPVNDLPPRQRPACQLPTGCSLSWAGLVAEASLERS